MGPERQRLASLVREVCTVWFQFFGAVFASKGYPFKNIFSNRWCKREHIEPDALKEKKINIFKIIDTRFYPLNRNILFVILNQVSRIFILTMFWFQQIKPLTML